MSSATGACRVLSYDGLSVRVEAEMPEHLEWIEEFFSPHFHVGADGTADVTVVLNESQARFDALHARGPAGPVVDCFALDSGVIRMPVWDSGDDDTVVYDTQYKLFYRVSPDRSRVEILTTPHNPLVRTPLMRVVREYAMIHSQLARQGVFLHASALGAGDDGIIITGSKSSGKTTLLTYLLQRSTVRYLANDRVLVSKDTGGILIRGMPAIVTLRPDMLDRFPALRERFLSGYYSARQTLREVAARTWPTKPWSDGRYGLTPGQYCHLLGATPLASARLSAILFPSITRAPGAMDLRLMQHDEATERVRASLLGTYDWEKSHDLFRPPGLAAEIDRKTLEDRICSMLAETRCFECRLGLQAYDEPGPADRVLAELIQTGARRS